MKFTPLDTRKVVRLWEISDIVGLLEEREKRILAEEREERLKGVYRHVLPKHYE